MDEQAKETKNLTDGRAYIVLAIVLLLLLVAAGFLLFKSNNTDDKIVENQPIGSQAGQNNQQPAQTGGGQKLMDSPDAGYAYKIYPGELSQDAKTALTSFKMTTKTLSDGSTQVDLTSANPQYQPQTLIIKKGYSLYFIERNLFDDNKSTNKDRTLRDDTGVLVDKNGYIVK